MTTALNISSDYQTQKIMSSETMKPMNKVVDVAIQVVSVDGILAKESYSKEKIKKSEATTSSSGSDNENFATIVASFAHTVATGKKSFLTHVPSSPLKLSAINRHASQHVAYWPSQASDEDGSIEKQSLSTLQFKRHFEAEDVGSGGENEGATPLRRFIPQSCPIHLSISRNGKLVVIGSANIIINGEEKGDSSITIPIISNLRKSSSPIKKMRRMKGKDDLSQMMKIKGDRFQFGLKSDSTLRVIVRVSDIDEVNTKHERSVAKYENTGKDPAHDTTMDSTVSDSDCESIDDCESIEGASVEKDDWEQYMLTQNELRHLQRELARTENENKGLRMELSILKSTGQKENERLCMELKELREHVKTTVGSLRDELTQKHHENELLPIYEERIRELVNELGSRDIELQNLKDEIEEIRQFYRAQVDSLLPEDNEESETYILDCSDIESCCSTDEGQNTLILIPMSDRIRNNVVAVTRDEPSKESDHITTSSEAHSEEVGESNVVSPEEFGDVVIDEEKLECPTPLTLPKESSIEHTETLSELHASKNNNEVAEFDVNETSINDYSKDSESDGDNGYHKNAVQASLHQPTTNVDLLLWDNEEPKSAPDRNRSILGSPGGEGLSSLLGRIRKIRKRMVEARESNDKVDRESEANCAKHFGDSGEFDYSSKVKQDQRHEAGVTENIGNKEKHYGSILVRYDQEPVADDAENCSEKGECDSFARDKLHRNRALDAENCGDSEESNDVTRVKRNQELGVCSAENASDKGRNDDTTPIEEICDRLEEVISSKKGRESLELHQRAVQSKCAKINEDMIEAENENQGITLFSEETNVVVGISTSDSEDEVEFIGDLFA
mmetsp:Transcript_15394/g.32647  ORF Transcript_15394/g.32647 Transcript_15394/m.32647 type:complete len:848 (+) Transcript_15394:174-2717(+)